MSEQQPEPNASLTGPDAETERGRTLPVTDPVRFKGPGQWRSQAEKAQRDSPDYRDESAAEQVKPEED